MSKTAIVLIRHGETEWNVAGRFHGQLDSSLTVNGMSQASALARRMKCENLSQIYCSDLGRAVYTAQVISEVTGHALRLDERIREKSLGVLESLDLAEATEGYPHVVHELGRRAHDYVIPDGESSSHVLERMLQFLDECVARHPGERVAVVSHGAVISILLCHVLNIPWYLPRRFHVPNASIHEIAWEHNSWWLTMRGDVRHLRADWSESHRLEG